MILILLLFSRMGYAAERMRYLFLDSDIVQPEASASSAFLLPEKESPSPSEDMLSPDESAKKQQNIAAPPGYIVYNVPRNWLPGEHPRILFTPEEIPLLQAKISALGSKSANIWASVKYNSKTPNATDFFTPINAAIIHQLDDTGLTPGYGRRAVNALLNNLIRIKEPPYDGSFSPGLEMRNLALVYDLGYDVMTTEERALFQEEMMKAASMLAYNFCLPSSPSNHGMVASSGLGLAAIALQADIPEDPRVYTDIPIVRNPSGIPGYSDCDSLFHWSATNIIKVGNTPGASDYIEGTHFQLSRTSKGYAIKWISGGPSSGSTYYVTYRFTPKIQDWKKLAQLIVQRNLDSLFSSGAYQGGVLYGSWNVRWLLDLVEGFRRDSGINFGRHTNLKNMMRWFPYELRVGDSAEYNNLNDSHYYSIEVNTFDAYLTWLRKEYAGDLGNLDKLSLWYDQREGNDSGNDARLALWENDSLYTGTTPIDVPLDIINRALPKSRHFLGRGLAYLRSGNWDLLGQPLATQDYALSFFAGHNTRSEHSNTDHGSFTLTELGRRPFVIDNGYAQGNIQRDPTAAHNYILIDGLGQPGPWSSSSQEPESNFGEFADLLYADLKQSFIDTWPGNQGTPADRTRHFDYADRYIASIKPTGSSIAHYYLVIDELQKQGAAPGSFKWILHTSPAMPILLDTQKAVLGGEIFSGRRQPQLDLFVISPQNATINTDIWHNSEGVVGDHPRLLIDKNVVSDPRYFMIMVPHDVSLIPSPEVVPFSTTGGAASEVRWQGATDTLIYRYKGSSTATSQNISSDAKITVIRRDQHGALTGYLFGRGKNLNVEGVSFISVLGGSDAYITASYQNNRVDISANYAWVARVYAPLATGVFIDGQAVSFLREGDYIIVHSQACLEDLPNPSQPLFEENFDDNVADYFFHTNFNPSLAPYGKSGVKNGAFELFGNDGLISYTHRQYSGSNPDATIMKYPLTYFGDVAISGKFKFQSVSVPGTLYLGFRTQDTEFYYMNIRNQKYYRIAIVPQNNQVLLEKVDNATRQILSTNYVTFNSVSWYSYNIEVADSKIKVTLQEIIGSTPNTVLNLQYDEISNLQPSEGYLQWSATGDLNVFLDDLSVLPVLKARPLEIASVSVNNISTNSAEISWLTNDPASSQVFYGLDANYGNSTPLDATPVIYHRVNLSGLSLDRLYHFSASSLDGQGAEVLSLDTTFRTALRPNYSPRLGPVGGQTVIAGQRLRIILTARDEDSDLLTYTFNNLPAGAELTIYNSIDTNGDRMVNMDEFNIFTQHYLSSAGEAKYDMLWDFNKDRKINLLDLAMFAYMYGHELKDSVFFNRADFYWTPAQSQVGKHNIVISVSDGLSSDTMNLEVTVLPNAKTHKQKVQ